MSRPEHCRSTRVPVLDRLDCDAVIFDLDGVITDTARIHFAAWKRVFDQYLRSRDVPGSHAFTEVDYQCFVDGKPRDEGVADFLESRGIVLPRGTLSDPPGAETVWGVANRKNEEFRRAIHLAGVDVYPTSVALVRELLRRGFGVAVVSASRNCREILRAAAIEDLFAVRVDGLVAAELRLAGKPAPDMFLEAARRLSVAPPRVAVVEDALAGVEGGRRGGFGLVIGVDRVGHAGALRDHGADVVVSDLGEIRVA